MLERSLKVHLTFIQLERLARRFALLFLCWGCSSTSAQPDSDRDSSTTGGAGGTSTNMTGGMNATGGATTSRGSASCNGDRDTLPIDATGWVPGECNDFDIQGAWYCYDDGVNPTSCVEGEPPFDTEGGGMCLNGATSLDPTYAAWGAGIGLSLNDAGMSGGKSAYDAASHGVTGISIEIVGDTGGTPLRVSFTGAADSGGKASPFWEVPGVGAYDIAFADAIVPEAWMIEESGTVVDPTSIFDIQVQVVGGELAANYDFCVTKLTPIGMGGTDPDSGGAGGMGNTVTDLPAYGTEQCARYATIDLPGQYMIQNNIWNDQAGSQQQCVTALWSGSGSTAGFRVAPVGINVSTPEPASYPSVVYGWHYGEFSGSYAVAKQISAVAAVPSNWHFSVPAGGRYNVSYDLWLHPQNSPGSPEGGLELMIWLNTRDVTPIGTKVEDVSFGSATWEVWYGQNAGWNTVTYKRATNVSSAELDLLQFIDDAVERGYAQAGWYALGVQAGFEIWQQSQTMTTDAFSVSIN